MTSPSVLVVGAGISGLSCARALTSAGVSVAVVDRGRAAGGRMSSRTIDGRVVDLGASYFTASAGGPFETVVQDWLRRGVARAWTDTFAVADATGIRDSRTGPLRYAAPRGLRDVVRDLADGLQVTYERTVTAVSPTPDGVEVDGEFYDHVVLAMPDPQASRLLSPAPPLLDRDWEPTIAAVFGFNERAWAADLHGAFVHDSPEISFLADDGDRRGDHAPVLVVHSTAQLAEAHLGDPTGALAPMLDATRRLLGITDAPISSHAHRWTFARPSATHGSEGHATPYLVDGRVAVCGDSWGEKSSVETAWTSGYELGTMLGAV